jgi:hypothetical protein
MSEERQETTGGALNAEALRSLQDFFLLLDEWDRAMHDDRRDAQNSPGECEFVIDTEKS